MGIPIEKKIVRSYNSRILIFTYGDLVTLLLCFFILLFSMCKYEIEKFKSVAESFKPLPAGTPFMEEGMTPWWSKSPRMLRILNWVTVPT